MSGVSTPVINDMVHNFPNAAAQPVEQSPLRRRGAIHLGRTQQHPNGTVVQPNIAAAARQANANAARHANAAAEAPAEAAAATTSNSMNTNEGGKRSMRKRSIRKTHRRMKKTRHNKNKRSRKH
jgi:hypothetical protein